MAVLKSESCGRNEGWFLQFTLSFSRKVRKEVLRLKNTMLVRNYFKDLKVRVLSLINGKKIFFKTIIEFSQNLKVRICKKTQKVEFFLEFFCKNFRFFVAVCS